MTYALTVAAAEPSQYQQRVAKLGRSISARLRRVLRGHALIHLTFLSLFTAEVGALAWLFPFLLASSILALGLAAIFLTGFSYFVLRLYLQAKKPEQLLDLRDLYLESCKSLLDYQEGIPEHHLALASAACRLGNDLADFEYTLYRAPFKSLRPWFERLSHRNHWRDLLAMRELLFTFAIEEQLKLIKCDPTDQQLHAALANSYVLLAHVYCDPREEECAPDLREKFRRCSERAIEEYQILGHFAPNDPWVHEQLAYTYSELQMPDDEIREYETILQLRSNDNDILFKLGMRYFEQGYTARGLQVYEALRELQYEKAEDLLHFYG